MHYFDWPELLSNSLFCNSQYFSISLIILNETESLTNTSHFEVKQCPRREDKEFTEGFFFLCSATSL